MSARKWQKLNQLHRDLPEGLVVDAAWLEGKGYYGSLRARYVSSGWLEQPARGVYRRPARSGLSWQQVVISLQWLLKLRVSVGGKSALDLQGYAHYLSVSPRAVHLYYDSKLPGWLTKLYTDAPFVVHKRSRVFKKSRSMESSERSIDDERDQQLKTEGLKHQSGGQWEWPLVISTPERAFLELLDDLPDRDSFHQVDMIAEGLSNLSPSRLQRLLERCTNVKVKRLFFFFADRHDHQWLAKLDRARIDLGSGKRVLVENGHLDAEYQITVPKDFRAV